jgi:putative FmdB family regulatory protein
MPLYEYRCRKCGNRFEEIQNFSDPRQAPCPKCSGEGERLFSAPAFHLKGSGWYKTDYGSSGASSSSPSKNGDSKSDEKPAASSGEGGSATSPSPSTPAPASGASPSEGSKKSE